MPRSFTHRLYGANEKANIMDINHGIKLMLGLCEKEQQLAEGCGDRNFADRCAKEEHVIRAGAFLQAATEMRDLSNLRNVK